MLLSEQVEVISGDGLDTAMGNLNNIGDQVEVLDTLQPMQPFLERVEDSPLVRGCSKILV